MSKPFKSIEEQIVLLKSRGLEFNDEESITIVSSL